MEHKIRESPAQVRSIQTPLIASLLEELEAVLREKDQALHALQPKCQTASPASSMHSLLNDTKPPELSVNGGFSAMPKYMNGEVSPSALASGDFGSFPGPSNGHMGSRNGIDGVNGASGSGGSAHSAPHPSASPSMLAHTGSSPASVDDFNIDIRSWPPNLPTPEITRHL